MIAKREAAARAVALLTTIDALLACWIHGLQHDDHQDAPLSDASEPQVSMRAICALLFEAQQAYDDAFGFTADEALMFARGHADMIEAALWNVCSEVDDAVGPTRAELATAAGEVRRLVVQARRAAGGAFGAGQCTKCCSAKCAADTSFALSGEVSGAPAPQGGARP